MCIGITNSFLEFKVHMVAHFTQEGDRKNLLCFDCFLANECVIIVEFVGVYVVSNSIEMQNSFFKQKENKLALSKLLECFVQLSCESSILQKFQEALSRVLPKAEHQKGRISIFRQGFFGVQKETFQEKGKIVKVVFADFGDDHKHWLGVFI